MRILKLMFINFKFMIKDKKTLFLMFMLPLVVVSIVGFVLKNNKDPDYNYHIAIINNDAGNYGKQMISKINEKEKNYYNIKVTKNLKESEESVKHGKYLCLFIIDSNFSSNIEKGISPEIKLVRSDNENVSFKLKNDIDNFIKKNIIFQKLEKDIGSSNIIIPEKNIISINVKEKSNAVDYSSIMLLLIINFIVFSANYVSFEIFDQKKSKTLRRQISMPYRPWEIGGGLILGFALTQMIVYLLVFAITGFAFNMKYNAPIGNIILGMVAMVIFSVSLGLFVVRITSNEGLISIIINIIGMGAGFLSGSFSGGILPRQVKVFSKITPQYYFMNIMNGKNLIINIFLILLISMVLFTAGSLKFERFIKE